MTAISITESVLEIAALKWFETFGYEIASGIDVAPGKIIKKFSICF